MTRDRRQLRRPSVPTATTLLLALSLTGCTASTPAHATAAGTTNLVATTTNPATSPTTTTTTTTTAQPSPSTSTTSATMRPVVVGLGDSVMSGKACDCHPFLDLYADGLARTHHLSPTVQNLGSSGLTVPGLQAQLSTPAAVRSLHSASIVVVTIGANDLVPLIDQWDNDACGTTCITTAAGRLRTPLDKAFTRIRALAPSNALVLVTNYWNVFEDGDVAAYDYGHEFAAWSDEVTAAANTSICAAAARIDATCVDTYRPFNGSGDKNPTSLLADDGDHPNAAGHAAIAKALLAATPARLP